MKTSTASPARSIRVLSTRQMITRHGIALVETIEETIGNQVFIETRLTVIEASKAPANLPAIARALEVAA